MQPETPDQSSWSFYEDMSLNFDQLVEPHVFTINNHVGDCEFTSLFNTQEDTTSEIYSISFPCSTMFTNDHILYPIIHEELETLQLPSLMEDFSMDLDDFDPIPSSHVFGIQGYQEQSEGSFPSQNFSSEVEDAWSHTPTPSMNSELTSIQPSLTLPKEDTEIDNQVSLPHLLEAFGEAMEQGEKSLAEVILRCINQKVSPLGESLERLSFYLSQEVTNHHGGDYLKGEALKNFEAALRALYQGLPNGKVAHFAAISTIIEAIPQDCDDIHIVDFQLEEGLQWPPMFEAIAKLHKTLKLTSIKWGGDESSECISTPRSFEETRRQLLEHARSCGLVLTMEEKGMEEVVSEVKKMNKRSRKYAMEFPRSRKEFLAFNCMVGLPHMGRVRSRKDVMEFLRVAKDLIKSSGNKGIITFGDGGACEKLKNSLNFMPFFEGHLMHFLALLESIESHFTTQFSEARTVMEFLFVAPYISSLAWLQNWEEMKSDCHLLQVENGLEGCRFSQKILMEISEVLRGSEGSYQTRIEGQNGNELVLEYKGTQLVRISTWQN